jgi:hypothetical protein
LLNVGGERNILIFVIFTYTLALWTHLLSPDAIEIKEDILFYISVFKSILS